MYDFICNNCKTSFVSNDKRRKFCSKKCANKVIVNNRIGKNFSSERKKNISFSKSRKPTEHELIDFKKLVDLGMPKGYLIKYFNLWQRAINNWLEWYYPNKSFNLMKCLENKITHEQVNQIILLTKSKVRHRRISKMLGISRKTVLKILKHHKKINPSIEIYSFDSEMHTNSRSNFEIEVGNILEKMSIKLEPQFFIKNNRFNYDYRVCGTNILIEVNGDYYHCNTKIYKPPYKKYHIWVMAKDKAKKLYAEKNGYKVLYIWELDFKKNKNDAINELVKEIENAKN